MEEPPKLDYGTHGPPPIPSRTPSVGYFFAGLAGGSAISLIWPITWTIVENKGDVLVTLLASIGAIKFIGGIVLSCIRGKRAIGAGILCSLATGGLIFFGTCAGYL